MSAGVVMDSKKPPEGIVLTPEQKKRQRERSIAIALALGVLKLDPLALIAGFIAGQMALLVNGIYKTE